MSNVIKVETWDLRVGFKSVVKAQKQGQTQGVRFRLTDPGDRQEVVVRRQKQGRCPEIRSKENIQCGQGRIRESRSQKFDQDQVGRRAGK